jgi:hypothetical protein
MPGSLFARIAARLWPRARPDRAHAGDVLARHAEDLMRTHGVMSVGIGVTPAGEPAIVVGVSALRAMATGVIPPVLEGVTVIVREIGTPQAR